MSHCKQNNNAKRKNVKDAFNKEKKEKREKKKK